MKALSVVELENRLDTWSTKRLHAYQTSYSKDVATALFDDRAVEALLEFAIDPAKVESELGYLERLQDPKGLRFSRSAGYLSDVRDQLANFKAKEKNSFAWNRHFQAAKAIVLGRYSQAHLRALDYSSDQSVWDALHKWDTATGWTAIEEGIRHKCDLREGIYSRVLESEARALRDGSFNAPIIMGSRFQGSGAYDDRGNRTNTCKHKRRAVFMVDVFQVITEARWGTPLTEWLKAYPYSAVGKTNVDVSRWINGERANRRSFVSLDYSKFDSTIPSWMIRAAFDVLRSAFVGPSNLDRLLAVVEEDFINKNIVTWDGVVRATHGNPSGSRLTTIINGIVNEIMTETWLQRFGVRAEYQIMGDDNLIFFHQGRVDVGSVASYLTHNFGIKVNADKSNSGSCVDDPEYLGRRWGAQGCYVTPGDAIIHIAYPERFRNYRTGLDPWDILYAQVLNFPATMSKLIDLPRFLKSYRPTSYERRVKRRLYAGELPYRLQVGMGFAD